MDFLLSPLPFTGRYSVTCFTVEIVRGCVSLKKKKSQCIVVDRKVDWIARRKTPKNFVMIFVFCSRRFPLSNTRCIFSNDRIHRNDRNNNRIDHCVNKYLCCRNNTAGTIDNADHFCPRCGFLPQEMIRLSNVSDCRWYCNKWSSSVSVQCLVTRTLQGRGWGTQFRRPDRN